MADVNPIIPDEFQLYIREQLARIEQLHADAEKKRQDIEVGPKLLRLEMWKVVIAALAAVGIVSGAIGYKIGITPPPPIVIQLPGAGAAR